jgi:hypothetical protein
VLGSNNLRKESDNTIIGKTFGNIDERFTGAGDFVQGGALTGKNDLLIREVTDGRIFVWQMNGNLWQTGDSIRDTIFNQLLWDTEWKMDTEPLTDSTWKISGFFQPALTASVLTSSSIRLSIIDYPLDPGESFKIERRTVLPTIGSWEVRHSAWTGAVFDDSGVQSGSRYEYRVQAYLGSTPQEPLLETYAAIEQVPDAAHYRGEIALLVEDGLPAKLGSYYDLFKDNLAGDGWSIDEHTGMARHDDSQGANNQAGVSQAKNAIGASAKAVIILGHVAIPKSGDVASDNHSDHATAWTADAFYGDSDGDWGSLGNGVYSANFIPDGPGGTPLERFVGRLDFARQASFVTVHAPPLRTFPGDFSLAGVTFHGESILFTRR